MTTNNEDYKVIEDISEEKKEGLKIKRRIKNC